MTATQPASADWRRTENSAGASLMNQGGLAHPHLTSQPALHAAQTRDQDRVVLAVGMQARRTCRGTRWPAKRPVALLALLGFFLGVAARGGGDEGNAGY